MNERKDELIRDEMSRRIVDAARGLAAGSGVHSITVRDILKELDITNRVFYNRFHNMDEVLESVYNDTVIKIRESLSGGIDPGKDFFEQVTDIVEKTLIKSYEAKMELNYYVFENDSLSDSNFRWWTAEIKEIIEYAKANGYIKDIDADVMSYTIWCFIRGFNADAVGRKIPMQEAAASFRYGFGVLLDGMKR